MESRFWGTMLVLLLCGGTGACTTATEGDEGNQVADGETPGNEIPDSTEPEGPPPFPADFNEHFSAFLPIVTVDALGGEIVDEPKIPARMQILSRDDGQPNRLGDPATGYDGGIGIEIRGATSQAFPKKQYAVETRDEAGKELDVALLGMPEESDWILQGAYLDRSLLRNPLAYALSRAMGHYAARSRFAEAFFKQGDATDLEYGGVYSLMEKIKRDANRVNLTKLSETQNAEPEVSGGYLLSLDKVKAGDAYFDTVAGTRVLYIYPKGEDITPQQQAWIQNYLNGFETALAGQDFADPDLGFRAYLDPGAMADFFLLNELCKNYDAFRFSTYFSKDRGGKIVLGPVWDFDIAMGNDNINDVFVPDVSAPEGWLLTESRWIGRMLEDPNFAAQVVARYRELRNGAWADEAWNAQLDALLAELGEAPQRNFLRWPILDLAEGPFFAPAPGSYGEEVARLREWLGQRMAWLDAHIDELEAP